MEKFEYTYSAPTEEEKKKIESIRRQYVEESPSGESKVERIKALDGKVKNTATIVSLVLGVAGCLLFGLGLTMILEWSIWLWGIVCMAVGCLPMIAAYPVHHALIKSGKKKYGEEIVRLAEELLHD
ncbi:MAG: hypothetical protein IJY11_03615 [Clostridia bacterium]|nr:hypothetical protein [Clostridia bacterium]